MTTIKQPCVAGQFYPADPTTLQKMVNGYLAAVKPADLAPPKALIAPHAGYIYSGPIAASGYALLPTLNKTVTRVVLLGPAHRYPVLGIAATKVDQFATPLGNIDIDKQAVTTALTLPFVTTIEQAYTQEHALEVHLPFLQTVLTNFKLAPFVVGNAKPEDVAKLINTLWGGSETLFVISSDLSHYYDYDTANKLDQAASQAIVNLRPQDIHDNQACGRLPIKGMLLAAKQHNMKVIMLDQRNSGDTAGDKSRVVGYGAYYLGF